MHYMEGGGGCFGLGGSAVAAPPARKVAGGVRYIFTLNCHSYFTVLFFFVFAFLSASATCSFTFLFIRAIVFLPSPSLIFQFQSCQRFFVFFGVDAGGRIFCIVKSLKGERIGFIFLRLATSAPGPLWADQQFSPSYHRAVLL